MKTFVRLSKEQLNRSWWKGTQKKRKQKNTEKDRECGLNRSFFFYLENHGKFQLLRVTLHSLNWKNKF